MDVRKKYDTTFEVGRMINSLSHQLKRQMCILEEESGLTNMQSLVLHYIAFQTVERNLYQKDVEKAFQIRRSTATGILQFLEKEGYIYRESVDRDARLKKDCPYREDGGAAWTYHLQHPPYGENSSGRSTGRRSGSMCARAGADVCEFSR